jgi:hypothetical protein
MRGVATGPRPGGQQFEERLLGDRLGVDHPEGTVAAEQVRDKSVDLSRMQTGEIVTDRLPGRLARRQPHRIGHHRTSPRTLGSRSSGMSLFVPTLAGGRLLPGRNLVQTIRGASLADTRLDTPPPFGSYTAL